MTNIEALRADIIYPVEDSFLTKAILDRGLTDTDTYSVTDNKRLIDLALADCFVKMVTTPSITEGGFQLTLTDKSNLIKVASGIYDKYGESNPLNQAPKINDKTNYW